MANISATILTFNEEKRIKACIDSLRGIADEIIVVDSFSTDRTAEICRREGCEVTQRRLAGYGAQRQYATSLTSYPFSGLEKFDTASEEGGVCPPGLLLRTPEFLLRNADKTLRVVSGPAGEAL